MDNWVLKRAMLTPERTAVFDGETRYTFGDVFDEAQRLGGVLSKFGAFKTQNVAMVSNNNVRGYLLAVTLLLYGKTVVWLNKRLTNDELAGQMRDAGVACCLKDDSLPDDLLDGASADGNVHIVGFDEIFTKADSFKLGDNSAASLRISPIPREFSDDQVVSIMFTSGSTGAPKGIQQTVRNHFTSATSVALNLGTSPADEWLCAVPIFHISGYSIILRGLIFGVAVRLMNHFDAPEMERILTNEPVTWVSVVPTMLKELVPEHERRISGALGLSDSAIASVGMPNNNAENIADSGARSSRASQSDVPSVQALGSDNSGIESSVSDPVSLPANFGYSPAFKGFILGGEKSDLKLLKRCNKLGMIVVRSYGMTETCSQIVGTGTGDGARKLLASGKPYFTTSLELADETGEILIKTGALTPGYLNRPGVFEARKTGDGWYRTGDVGHLDDDGYLYVDGRLDNMMISGGEHVFPEEVERVYAECPGIDDIAVTAEPDEKWGEVPVAYVVCKEGYDRLAENRQPSVAAPVPDESDADESAAKNMPAIRAGAITTGEPTSRVDGRETDESVESDRCSKAKQARAEVSGSLDARWREFGRDNLAHYKVPQRFYRVDSLPRTSTGKIRRFLLGEN
ncbi:AMP-binding protein [Bifidobacterium sp. ESL0784]|uniref:AMP-binding protein n=1 Tax=Bifidobacterium sp. ESL0784 TaxID=2983231 RepID=UPI0023F9A631|nr:AMP-binding protein [Bifidobacterium sp. ESL0784]MDF7640830.1 AMP-binding protein [Bifidobacterium sp. ESL0784]